MTRRTMGVLSLVLMTVIGGSTTAVAESPGVVRASSVEGRVELALQANPGSQLVSPNEIRLAEGVTMSFPSAQQEVAAVPADCFAGQVCFFQHSDYGGAVLRLSACRREDLRNYAMDPLNDWAFEISSWIDVQTGGAFAILYDINGAEIRRTNSPRAEDYVGDAANDWAVFVQTC